MLPIAQLVESSRIHESSFGQCGFFCSTVLPVRGSKANINGPESDIEPLFSFGPDGRLLNKLLRRRRRSLGSPSMVLSSGATESLSPPGVSVGAVESVSRTDGLEAGSRMAGARMASAPRAVA
jgi:hypothetical protein